MKFHFITLSMAIMAATLLFSSCKKEPNPASTSLSTVNAKNVINGDNDNIVDISSMK